MYINYQLFCLQIRMFAIQSTTAVNKFVWILMIPTSAGVMKNSFWRRMGRHVDVSSQSYKSMFLFEAFMCCGHDCLHKCMFVISNYLSWLIKDILSP